MGVFDTYGITQLKVGDCNFNQYNIGDKVEIPDGVYISYDGAVVVNDGVFICFFERLFDKWGNPLSIENILDVRWPFFGIKATDDLLIEDKCTHWRIHYKGRDVVFYSSADAAAQIGKLLVELGDV